METPRMARWIPLRATSYARPPDPPANVERWHHDKRAIPTLVAIVNNPQEIDYFRGDALEAIYQIDRELGISISNQYINETNYLKHSVGAIQKLKLKVLSISK